MTRWLEAISPQLNVLWRGKWKRGAVEPGRYLYDHELVMVLEGSCVVQVGRREHRLGEGCYLIVPPEEFHATTVDVEGVYRCCVHFDWIFQARTQPHPICCYYPERPEPGRIAPTPPYVPEKLFSGRFAPDGPVPALIETLFHRWQTGDALSRAACRATFLEILLNLIWRDQGRRPPPDRSTQLAYAVKALLDRSGGSPEGLQELLPTLGFSYAHLCRLFRRKFGVTPGEYRTAIRLEKAKTLLRNPRLSVTEVAAAVGFCDPGYFARRFRRQNATPPSGFR
jgi:AraC-like DNA-binding protein